MTVVQVLPKLDSTKEAWMRVFQTEIYWPWYTLIGCVITLSTALITGALFPAKRVDIKE